MAFAKPFARVSFIMELCLVLVELAAYRLVPKTLERHGPF